MMLPLTGLTDPPGDIQPHGTAPRCGHPCSLFSLVPRTCFINLLHTSVRAKSLTPASQWCVSHHECTSFGFRPVVSQPVGSEPLEVK